MTAHSIPEARQRSYDIKAPYSGYCLGKLPSEDAEITHVGPGTPCGEYMRRFWQPVCLFKELGQYPLAIRIMGEDLVAFRDKSGRVGVLHRHCTHRGASLEYGLISKHGIRCCYHGWQFDVDGTILDTPGELSGSRIHLSLKQGAYPAHEHWGLVFAYMGPPEEKPDFPGFEDYGTPEEGIIPYSTWHPCNWLQCHDNFMDPVHAVFLHSRMTGDQLTPAWGKMPVVEWYETGGGNGIIYVATRRMDDQHVWNRINHVILPNYCEVGTAFEEGDKQKYFQRNTWNRWLVPVDDTHSWTFGWRHFRPGVDDGKGDPEACGRDSIDIGAHQHHGGRTYEERQRAPGDWDAQTGQRPIAIHALEHPGWTDTGVMMWRRLLRRGIRGETPAATPEGIYGPPERKVGSLAHDCIFKMPLRHGVDDNEAMRDMGRRVTDVVMTAEDLPHDEQQAVIIPRLEELQRQIFRE